MSRSSGGHAGSTQLHNSISFVSTSPPNPFSHLLLHIPSSLPKNFKKKKNKPTLVPPSPTTLSQKSCKKKLKKISANARRKELEKHWDRLNEEAKLVWWTR
jgi:hypothetical protein